MPLVPLNPLKIITLLLPQVKNFAVLLSTCCVPLSKGTEEVKVQSNWVLSQVGRGIPVNLRDSLFACPPRYVQANLPTGLFQQ